MAIQRGVLIIADIGGYTHYMNWNRMHLAHAQLTVAALLDELRYWIALGDGAGDRRAAAVSGGDVWSTSA